MNNFLNDFLLTEEKKKPNSTTKTKTKSTTKTKAKTTSVKKKTANKPVKPVVKIKGNQSIEEAEKKLAFKNAIENDMYTIISNALKQQRLENFDIKASLAVILAIISVESRCDIKTQESTAGAIGVMQITSNAAKDVGEPNANLKDVNENVRIGIKYMNRLMNYMKKNAIKNGKSLWDSQTGYIFRLAWMCLGFNNGLGNIKANFLKGTDIKNTTYYKNVKTFYNFWSQDAVIKKFIQLSIKAKALKDQLNHDQTNESYYIYNDKVISESLLRDLIQSCL